MGEGSFYSETYLPRSVAGAQDALDAGQRFGQTAAKAGDRDVSWIEETNIDDVGLLSLLDHSNR